MHVVNIGAHVGLTCRFDGFPGNVDIIRALVDDVVANCPKAAIVLGGISVATSAPPGYVFTWMMLRDDVAYIQSGSK